MMSEDIYEPYTIYRMSTADEEINAKLEILKLEQGISISKFITAAVYEKLKEVGCDFSDHSPTKHTRLKQKAGSNKKKQNRQCGVGSSGLNDIRDSLFRIQFSGLYSKKSKK